MSYCRTANKLIYRKYRIIRRIIWTIPFINLTEYRKSMLSIINTLYYQTKSLYSFYACLVNANNYYRIMCIEEMHERIRLNKVINDMHKRFKLGINVKEIL